MNNSKLTNKNYEEIVAKTCFKADECFRTYQRDFSYRLFVPVVADMVCELANLKGFNLSKEKATALALRLVKTLPFQQLLQLQDLTFNGRQDAYSEVIDRWVECLAQKNYDTLDEGVA